MPSTQALFELMTASEQDAFVRALLDDLRARQGDGPYAITSEGLIAVAGKAA